MSDPERRRGTLRPTRYEQGRVAETRAARRSTGFRQLKCLLGSSRISLMTCEHRPKELSVMLERWCWSRVEAAAAISARRFPALRKKLEELVGDVVGEVRGCKGLAALFLTRSGIPSRRITRVRRADARDRHSGRSRGRRRQMMPSRARWTSSHGK